MNKKDSGMNVLSFLAISEKPCSLSEISEKLSLEPGNMERILWMLEELKCVVHYPDDTYSLGDEPLPSSAADRPGINLNKICQPYIFALNDITHETAGLYFRTGFEDYCADQVESNQMLRIVLPLGLKCPLWSGATGKAMLAYMGKNEVEGVIRSLEKLGEPTLASGKIVEISKLLDEIDGVKQLGFSTATEERARGVVCTASPLIGHNNQVIGGICVTGPIARFNETVARENGPLVKRVAQNINLKLGARYLL